MSDLQHLDRPTIAGHRPSPSAAALDVGAPTTDVAGFSGTDVSGFTYVDTAADPDVLVGWMDTARTLPGLRVAKSLAVRALALRPGQVVADIGCGPGEDAIEMARRIAPGGQVIAIDASEVMLGEARRRAAAAGQPVDVRAQPTRFVRARPGRQRQRPTRTSRTSSSRASTWSWSTGPTRAICPTRSPSPTSTAATPHRSPGQGLLPPAQHHL
jgi:Methyltransferase domain